MQFGEVQLAPYARRVAKRAKLAEPDVDGEPDLELLVGQLDVQLLDSLAITVSPQALEAAAEWQDEKAQTALELIPGRYCKIQNGEIPIFHQEPSVEVSTEQLFIFP